MRTGAAVALLASLGACVDRPEVVATQRSPDGHLIARLVRTSFGATVSRLTLDVGPASDGPFTTLAELAEQSEPFPLRWRGPVVLEADLPCAVTTLSGALEQQITLPEVRGPVTVWLNRPTACKLPLSRMR